MPRRKNYAALSILMLLLFLPVNLLAKQEPILRFCYRTCLETAQNCFQR